MAPKVGPALLVTFFAIFFTQPWPSFGSDLQRAMSLRQCWIAIGLWFAGCASAAASEPWPEQYFNPAPAAGDLVLPMPCGGAMAFRPVEVPSDGAVDDRQVLLGDAEDRLGHAESLRYDHVAGGFTDPADPARRRYWLGKYEVTAMQAGAVSGACPEIAIAGRLPAAAMTWHGAAALAESYTTWLLANAPDALPREDGQPGFLRLPTEAEWEFAARGGIAVSPEQFRGRVFPMPEGMAAHVWFQGSRSAAGQAHPVGLLRPNPLGLHDLLGNVDEIVLDPFRLNRLGRLHGQPGGFIVKGGSFRTTEGEIRSAYRHEHAPFGPDGPIRLDTVGVRLAIGAPVLTSPARLDAIRAELAALGQEREPGAAPADALTELGRLVALAETPELRQRLESVAAALRSETEQQTARSARAAGSLIRLGAHLGSQIRSAAAPVGHLRGILAAFDHAGSDAARTANLRNTLTAAEASMQSSLEAYIDTAIVAAQNFEPAVLAGQMRMLGVELTAREQAVLVPFAELFTRHAGQFRASGQTDRAAWLNDLTGG